VQVVAQVVSCNPRSTPISGDDRRVGGPHPVRNPFSGPIGAARVGYVNGEYVLNPTATS